MPRPRNPPGNEERPRAPTPVASTSGETNTRKQSSSENPPRVNNNNTGEGRPASEVQAGLVGEEEQEYEPLRFLRGKHLQRKKRNPLNLKGSLLWGRLTTFALHFGEELRAEEGGSGSQS